MRRPHPPRSRLRQRREKGRATWEGGRACCREKKYLSEDTKDLLLGVGSTRETTNPASIPFSLKKHPTQVQSIEDEKHEREDYKF